MNLSENYYLRKCFLERDQVPTQSMMKKKMTPPLAAIYFKSMTPKLKELAGLEPPLRGGGNDWYVSPNELLEGRAVLKPIEKPILAKLNHQGIEEFGSKLFEKHRRELEIKTKDVLLESDINWRANVTAIAEQEWAANVEYEKNRNTVLLSADFKRFVHLYRMSLDKIEDLFKEAAIAEIKKTREAALRKMQTNYAMYLKSQSTKLYNAYEQKLLKEKARLKAEFVEKIEISRSNMSTEIHDLHVDKHLAIEKLKHFFARQNLACQVYVSLKEREECLKEMEELTHRHRDIVKPLSDKILFKEFEIHLAEKKKLRNREVTNIWQKKIFHVVKKFQMFVSYCLKLLPEHSEFFINMEKLMLLQINEALDNPAAESIIELEEKETFHTPIPHPQPFYLFCDKGYKARVDQDLCPKRSSVSSASQLPVIIINKRCIYAACDNFDQFTNKIKEYIHGERGDDTDVKDELIYEHFVPVKYTSSQQLLEVKLENSLLQVLQEEIAYLDSQDKEAVNCGFCRLPWCSCTAGTTTISSGGRNNEESPITPEVEVYKPLSRNMELEHENEPKWDSYAAYVKPKKCHCDKMAQKHLIDHLPVYMRRTKYGPPEIPDYEICSVTTLKTLVKEARHRTSPEPEVKVISPRYPHTKDISTQFSDVEFDTMCTCFSDAKLRRMLSNFTLNILMFDEPGWTEKTKVDSDLSPTHVAQGASSFASVRAHSLRDLFETLPNLQEIFKSKH